MARNRQWYQDVMDVALRATLKEFGFKRKSPTTYICERSADRLWTFSIGPASRYNEDFSDFLGIYVDAIEDIMVRHLPRAALRGRYEEPFFHAQTDIVELIKAENAWDEKTWQQSPRSRTWLGGYRPAPSVDTKVRHLRQGGCFSYVAAGPTTNDTQEEWCRRVAVITEELGHDLDTLWRTYALEWFQLCDDPLFFAEWIEQNAPPTLNAPARSAVGYHLAGADDRAADILGQFVEASQVPYEVLVEEIDIQKRGNPRWRWLLGERGKTRKSVENMARLEVNWRQRNADNARQLAKGLGISL